MCVAHRTQKDATMVCVQRHVRFGVIASVPVMYAEMARDKAL